MNDFIKYIIPTTEPCPIGWIRGRLPTGEEFWFDPDDVKYNMEVKSVLTDSEKERIKNVAWHLKEHDKRPLDVWFFNFSCEIWPEKEIRLYEALVRAYQAQLATRPHSKKERSQLYHGLLLASILGSAPAVLSSRPELKSLPNLVAAITAFVAYWQETWSKADADKYEAMVQAQDKAFQAEVPKEIRDGQWRTRIDPFK